jgi:uncharacterized protein YbjT (DUF2867 family)
MILVTGATGTVGRRLVAQLHTEGEVVRAVTHTPPAVPFPAGVEVVTADLADPPSLAPHLRGVQAVFLVWPFTSPHLTTRLAPQVIEALTAQSRRIVYLSAAAAADDPGSFWARVEQAIVRSGVPWTFLRPTGFAKNTLLWAPQIQAGDVVRWPYGQAVRALIHEDDIAAVAVQALLKDGHGQATYVLSGPAALTQADQVRVIGDVLQRPLRWEEEHPDMARLQLASAFEDAAFADAALAAWARFVDHPEQVTTTVEQLTGRPARRFAQWVADHAIAFRSPLSSEVRQGRRTGEES